MFYILYITRSRNVNIYSTDNKKARIKLISVFMHACVPWISSLNDNRDDHAGANYFEQIRYHIIYVRLRICSYMWTVNCSRLRGGAYLAFRRKERCAKDANIALPFIRPTGHVSTVTKTVGELGRRIDRLDFRRLWNFSFARCIK